MNRSSGLFNCKHPGANILKPNRCSWELRNIYILVCLLFFTFFLFLSITLNTQTYCHTHLEYRNRSIPYTHIHIKRYIQVNTNRDVHRQEHTPRRNSHKANYIFLFLLNVTLNLIPVQSLSRLALGRSHLPPSSKRR